jgi:TM2 domain-containing membrane protein YozV
MYAGKAGQGVALLLTYWVLFWVNVGLLFVVIGWVTMPLCWLGYMVAGPLLAARAVEDHNLQANAVGRY